ncbi:MAG: phage virion morphogenesis protein [Halieaceae bacterium]|nr:phage virion morphogenesis protein [Halieaceae bacterium]
MKIDIELDNKRVLAAINRLIQASTDLTPAMRVIAGHLEAGVERAFATETAPDGKAWPALSEVTRERRAAKGKWPGKKLQVQTDLLGSITSDHSATEAVVGTNLVYATTHQFGANKGAFGITSRGAPIPWGDIPARPFLGISADTETQVVDAIGDFLREQWR